MVVTDFSVGDDIERLKSGLMRRKKEPMIISNGASNQIFLGNILNYMAMDLHTGAVRSTL